MEDVGLGDDALQVDHLVEMRQTVVDVHPQLVLRQDGEEEWRKKKKAASGAFQKKSDYSAAAPPGGGGDPEAGNEAAAAPPRPPAEQMKFDWCTQHYYCVAAADDHRFSQNPS
nr:hypothetical protein Iba_chr10cCG0730 [Ipomoea batatas]